MIDYIKFISRRRYNTRTIGIASEVAQTPTERWDGMVSKLKCILLHVDFALKLLRQFLNIREKNIEYIRIM